MILETNQLQFKNGDKIELKQKLTCKNFEIYAACCKICKEYYTGQTKNSFSQRWNEHRAMWRKMVKRKNQEEEQKQTNKRNNDAYALFMHCVKDHSEFLIRKPEIWDVYELIFLEKPALKDLDYRENYWITKTNSKINISKTYLPKYT